ncbi:hypothetical protein EDB85DRAFT_2181820 [Lactarius pseudohatsudake]|nr:hypothetical protein EDB85DRAFT_2181820 [Lactarius pseudohatsudake]
MAAMRLEAGHDGREVVLVAPSGPQRVSLQSRPRWLQYVPKSATTAAMHIDAGHDSSEVVLVAPSAPSEFPCNHKSATMATKSFTFLTSVDRRQRVGHLSQLYSQTFSLPPPFDSESLASPADESRSEDPCGKESTNPSRATTLRLLYRPCKPPDVRRKTCAATTVSTPASSIPASEPAFPLAVPIPSVSAIAILDPECPQLVLRVPKCVKGLATMAAIQSKPSHVRAGSRAARTLSRYHSELLGASTSSAETCTAAATKIREERPTSSTDPMASTPQSRGSSYVAYRPRMTLRTDGSVYRSRGSVGGGTRRGSSKSNTKREEEHKYKAQMQRHMRADASVLLEGLRLLLARVATVTVHLATKIKGTRAAMTVPLSRGHSRHAQSLVMAYGSHDSVCTNRCDVRDIHGSAETRLTEGSTSSVTATAPASRGHPWLTLSQVVGERTPETYRDSHRDLSASLKRSQSACRRVRVPLFSHNDHATIEAAPSRSNMSERATFAQAPSSHVHARDTIPSHCPRLHVPRQHARHQRIGSNVQQGVSQVRPQRLRQRRADFHSLRKGSVTFLSKTRAFSSCANACSKSNSEGAGVPVQRSDSSTKRIGDSAALAQLSATQLDDEDDLSDTQHGGELKCKTSRAATTEPFTRGRPRRVQSSAIAYSTRNNVYGARGNVHDIGRSRKASQLHAANNRAAFGGPSGQPDPLKSQDVNVIAQENLKYARSGDSAGSVQAFGSLARR